MSSVLSLFDSVEVKASDVMINDIDRLFCERTEKQYKTLINQLQGYQLGLAELESKLPKLNPATINDDRYYVESNSDEHDNWTSDLAFSPAYGHLYILNTLEVAKKKFIDEIIEYFNRKYNLHFEIERDEEIVDPKWQTYVDRIVQYAGGALTDAGIRNLIDAFKSNYNHKDASISKETITIQDCWLKGYGNSMDGSSHNVKSLLRAIGYFETGQTNIPNYIYESFPCSHNDKIDHSLFRKASMLCEKFEGHKYFKNKRLDLKFKSSEAAHEFHSIFFNA